jgi:hypothetical protein
MRDKILKLEHHLENLGVCASGSYVSGEFLPHMEVGTG